MPRSKLIRSALVLSIVGLGGVSARTASAYTEYTPTEFTWGSNAAGDSVAMWELSEGYCYLTGVGGAFEGTGDLVHVTLSNGVWLLGGAGASGGTTAEAGCVPGRMTRRATSRRSE